MVPVGQLDLLGQVPGGDEQGSDETGGGGSPLAREGQQLSAANEKISSLQRKADDLAGALKRAHESGSGAAASRCTTRPRCRNSRKARPTAYG